jgi:hypothetical protein
MDYVYFPLLSINVDEVWATITGTFAEVKPSMLSCSWEGIHCRSGICDVISGSHIKL